MMKLLFIMISFFLISSNSPIILMMLVILQAMILSILIKTMISISWFSFILFLIFIGGLMIMFIYIASLSPNEVLTDSTIFYTLNSFIKLSIFLIMTTFIFLQAEMLNFYNPQTSNILPKMISELTSWVIITLFSYLLLVLLIVVFIILIKSGPLRSLIQMKTT